MALITLRVLDGADRGRVYTAMPTPITIGREEGNTIQLNDERVSRFHLKIQEDQDKVVLTDLESTNGTKVNGEDIQLRILRFGDLIAVGRSVLLFGSREEIAHRLAALRGADPENHDELSPEEALEAARAASLEYELNWSDNPNARTTFQTSDPPDLPQRLAPVQAAQLSELLEYLHIRIRDLLASVKPEAQAGRMSLDERHWQGLVDLQSRLAEYRRAVGEPPKEE
jgi:pSer/pThr/pTyr-binding forkhead associated (FHA) protein